ncbi:MAG: hypothetical protein GX456_16715 [Verrucomicrobia bacterium]|nr:hypothetical protein [Verrucomicrobiota bacterium]
MKSCVSHGRRCAHTTNNVSVPISASEGFLRRLRQPRIGTRGNLRATPQPGGNTQTTSLSPYLGLHPDREPVTLSSFEAPTARLIPAWGEAPRQGPSRHHFPQSKG